MSCAPALFCCSRLFLFLFCCSFPGVFPPGRPLSTLLVLLSNPLPCAPARGSIGMSPVPSGSVSFPVMKRSTCHRSATLRAAGPASTGPGEMPISRSSQATSALPAALSPTLTCIASQSTTRSPSTSVLICCRLWVTRMHWKSGEGSAAWMPGQHGWSRCLYFEHPYNNIFILYMYIYILYMHICNNNIIYRCICAIII